MGTLVYRAIVSWRKKCKNFRPDKKVAVNYSCGLGSAYSENDGETAALHVASQAPLEGSVVLADWRRGSPPATGGQHPSSISLELT